MDKCNCERNLSKPLSDNSSTVHKNTDQYDLKNRNTNSIESSKSIGDPNDTTFTSEKDNSILRNVPSNTNIFYNERKGIHIAALNINHVLPKLDEIKIHLSSKNSTHILGLTETFLSNLVSDNELEINCFVTERKDRTGKKGEAS